MGVDGFEAVTTGWVYAVWIDCERVGLRKGWVGLVLVLIALSGRDSPKNGSWEATSAHFPDF